MKGLLLKDYYMTVKYCKVYLLVMIIFILGSAASEDNLFFMFYPCLISGMLPVTLLGYDERSKWNQYCGIFPYTKAQIVSGKFLMGLFAQIVVITLSALTQAVKMNINGTFNSDTFLTLIEVLLILSCSSFISLPFIFKFGVEKGRIAYLIMVGVVCGESAAASTLFGNMETLDLSTGWLLPILCVVMVIIYALSWYLSIVFYKKQEK